MNSYTYNNYPFLKEIGIQETNKGVFTGKRWCGSAPGQVSVNPNNLKPIAHTSFATDLEYEETMTNMQEIKNKWMAFPMVKRGQILREVGDRLREQKKNLGNLISIEVGKIQSEGEGEVQESIDICDYAQGLSRTLSGKILQSERDDVVLYENWNPIGIVGVITAFNFPNAVLCWNTAIALVCGDLVMWKGSENTSLIHLATAKIFIDVLSKHGFDGVFTVVSGTGLTIGEKMLNDPRIALISFTGSTKVGRHVSKTVHGRFARTILELGGNNCSIVLKDADLSVTLPQIVFGAVGTAGQRCTTLSRLGIHEDIYDSFIDKMIKAYKTVSIGDSTDSKTLMGPLINKLSFDNFMNGVNEAKKQGGKVLYGGNQVKVNNLDGYFVEPTIIEIDPYADIVKQEIFAPILYVFRVKNIEDGIKINNSVPQGLSSSVFTNDLKAVSKWMGPLGSDCGLSNVNLSTSGAEIGGAFGGEKETGGGRESGGDAWRQYMKQSYSGVSYSTKVQLAQGIKFPKF